jgi:hypothetical protein
LNAKEASEQALEQNIDRYEYRRQLLADHGSSKNSPLISGHYPFNHQFYDQHGEDWNFITVLRDPVARWYSEYYWNKHKDHDYQKTNLSIEEYLETDDGKMNTRSFINYFSKSENHTGTPSTKDIETSIDTLKYFQVVGFLENIPKFRSDMKFALGRKPIIIRRNKSPADHNQRQRPDKNSEFHKNLVKLLEADTEVYLKTKELGKA